MPTYADYFNTANGGATLPTSGPVKLVVDRNDNVVEQILGMDIDHASEMIVEGIRHHRSSDPHGVAVDYHGDGVPDLASNSAGQIPSSTIVLVIDTNWLLSHLSLFEEIEQLIPPRTDSFSPVLFILPTAVFRELDGLKRSDAVLHQNDKTLSIATLARTATTFLLECLVQRPDLFRGQSSTETLFSKTELLVQDNDTKILDCCIYHQQKAKVQVGLLSNDKVLCAQATVQNVPFLQFEAAYKDPLAFLRKLHPDLPPYIQSLKEQAQSVTRAIADTAPASRSKPDTRAQTPADQKLQAKLAHLQAIQFPASPPELLVIVNTITSSLLAPIIFHKLLSVQANSNPEIFTYMLNRNSIMRPYGNRSNDAVLDYSEWTVETCLRLLHQNWSLCFAALAARSRGIVSVGSPAPSLPPTTNSGTPQSGSPLSSSRWAGRSTSSSAPSSTSPSRFITGQGAHAVPQNFHPSKLPALVSALSSSPADVQRWSAPRWKIVFDDLEALLCKTGLLDNDDDRRKVASCFQQWRANVECWKQAQQQQQ